MCLRRCCSASNSSAETKSDLLIKIWSAKPTWRRASWRSLSCWAACLASTKVNIESSKKLSAISSSMKKVCATGPGSAKPVVSITTRSKSSRPLRFLAAKSCKVVRKSSRMVQHTHPLFIWMICSLVSETKISLSMFSSPNSFSMMAIFWPWASVKTRLSKVVLPAPKKPVRMVAGINIRELPCRNKRGQPAIVARSAFSTNLADFMTTKPFRYSPSGKVKVMGWSGAPCIRSLI